MKMPKIAIVIPSYKVRAHILGVIHSAGPEVDVIYVVDDQCPESSGQYVAENCTDPRVRVLFNEQNEGVGGATLAGFSRAAQDGADIMIKIDGDGQMDPRLIPKFIAPIVNGRADYTKGNRFYNPEDVLTMPTVRLLGNAALSFMSKLSTGYWHVFDPTNGYLAISAKVFSLLPRQKIAKRYFFETDMLFRLNTIRAVVLDVPMVAVYGDETSGLKIHRELGRFMVGHLRSFSKRIFYNYFLRDFGVASVQLVSGVLAIGFGVSFGGIQWYLNAASGVDTPAGTVMIATLPIILGFQMLLSFLGYDISSTPVEPLQGRL
ncbi:MAG: glycosyltransferase family 2 protein [Pseudomonadota bacterium]|nr:glycosyltransferase family 2 protein [Pseudomonadota bacterium]